MPGTGLLPTDPTKRIVRAPAADHHVVRSSRAALKGCADLTPWAPKVLDQKQTSTCWAHSAVTLLYIRRNIKGTSESLMSPLYFAQVVYAAMRAAAYPGTMPPLRDTGADLDTADAAFGMWGCSPFGGTGLTDVPELDSLGYGIPELDEGTVAAARTRLFTGPYDITPDESAPETVAACLEAGIPIWIGTRVGRAFQSLGPGNVAQPCDPAEPGSGGHALVVAGYTDMDHFDVINSWGPDWCRGGHCVVSAAFLSTAWSLLPFEVV